MKGKDTCKWLLLGTTQYCGRSCMEQYCKIHLARLRKGPGTRECTGCGKGVKTNLSLCKSCGAGAKYASRAYAFKQEFKRIGAITI